jgi:iron complex outermembrane receptor protein
MAMLLTSADITGGKRFSHAPTRGRWAANLQGASMKSSIRRSKRPSVKYAIAGVVFYGLTGLTPALAQDEASAPVPDAAAAQEAVASTETAAASVPEPSLQDPLPEPAYEPAITSTIGDTSTVTPLGEQEAETLVADGEVKKMSAVKQRQVEEIVVTARRRDELLENTPVAVTALSANDLVDAGVTNLLEIGELVPNLQVIYSGSGAAFVIRGIGSFPAPYFDQGVGLYLDGVYIPRQQGNVTEMVDVAQIEVLRGPQGTLFGKNSAGGAIKITTAKPEAELGASLRLRYTTNDNVQTRAMLNVPINFGDFQDRLAVRLNLATTNQGGFVENEYNGQMLGNQDNLGFLGSLRFLITDDLVMDVSGLWNSTHSRGLGSSCTYIQESQFQSIMDLPPPLGPADYDQEKYREACQEAQRYKVNLDAPNFYSQKSAMVWGSLTWDIGDLGFFEDLQTQFLTSGRRYDEYRNFDADGTQFDVLVASSTGDNPYGGSPAGGWSITEEVQLTGAALDGRVKFVTGVFGSMESANDNLLLLVLPNTLADTNGGITDGKFETNNWDFSIFGQADTSLTDWLNLTGGIRFGRTKKAVERLRVQPVEGVYPGPVLCQPGTGPGYFNDQNQVVACDPLTGTNNRIPNSGRCKEGTGPLPVYDAEGNITEYRDGDTICDPEAWGESRYFTNWSPMISLQATMPEDLLVDTPIDHLMTYFQFARGYKTGGFNGGALDNDPRNRDSFDSEVADAFEIGLKSIWWDRMFSANLTGFVTMYQDLQLPTAETLFPAEGCVPPEGLDECNAVAASFTRNVPQANIRGIEFEFEFQPVEYIQLSGNIGMQDARIGEWRTAENPLTGEPENVSGQTFSFVPAINSYLALTTPFPVEFPMDVFSGLMLPRVDWGYQSDVQWFSRKLNEGATKNAALQKAYSMVNLRLTYLFNNSQTSVAIFGENMTDVELLTGVLNSSQRVLGTVLNYYGQGRAFGFEITHSF